MEEKALLAKLEREEDERLARLEAEEKAKANAD